MDSNKKDIFASHEYLRCPHCGEISRVDTNGEPIDFWRANGRVQDWAERCENCGKRFGVAAMFKIYKHE